MCYLLYSCNDSPLFLTGDKKNTAESNPEKKNKIL